MIKDTLKNIIIIGAGGYASECFMYLQEIIRQNKNIAFKGFLSSSNDLKPYGLEKFFLGHYDDFNFEENDYVVIAIGSCRARHNIFTSLKSKGLKFYNLISPLATLPDDIKMGEGNVIGPYVLITPNTTIGNCNVIQPYACLGHDATIGNYNFIGTRGGMAGWTIMGNDNFLSGLSMMLPHSKMGNHCKTSAGSVIFRKVKDNAFVMGNPAEVIGINED